MNEVRELVEAFDRAIAAGERCALATIVSVEGSSYRRPGARMLVRETGSTTGTISAGCLENDVIEHGRRVIHSGEAKLVQYDNGSSTDEIAWGLGLGCNGIVRVLIEPLEARSLYMDALRNSIETTDTPGIIAATVYQCTPSSTGMKTVAAGARVFIGNDDEISSEKLNGSSSPIIDEVRTKIKSGDALGDHTFDLHGSTLRLFVERIMPPVPLLIFGAGQDALAIVELAKRVGWQTEVIDPQARNASRERFATADRVTLARLEEVDQKVAVSARTMALVMSHNYSHDIAFLKFLLSSDARYIGVMGPRKRTERMLAELIANDSGFGLSESDLARIYSPVGLDIGANGPAEIALSIVTEMRAVMECRRGGMLRESRGPIQNATRLDPAAGEQTSAVSRDKEHVGAVILAAGSSSRMGRPKQTLQFENESLLRRSAVAALDAGCSPVIVVTGANAEVSRQELEGLTVREIWNPKWKTGMGSSIAAGIRDLLDKDPDVTAAVIMLCDQPYVDADVISRLVSSHRLARHTVIGSKYAGGFGVPALFTRSLFGELSELEGTSGAKAVISRHARETHFIAFPEGEIDIDTPDDYVRLISRDFNPRQVERR